MSVFGRRELESVHVERYGDDQDQEPDTIEKGHEPHGEFEHIEIADLDDIHGGRDPIDGEIHGRAAPAPVFAPPPADPAPIAPATAQGWTLTPNPSLAELAPAAATPVPPPLAEPAPAQAEQVAARHVEPSLTAPAPEPAPTARTDAQQEPDGPMSAPAAAVAAAGLGAAALGAREDPAAPHIAASTQTPLPPPTTQTLSTAPRAEGGIEPRTAAVRTDPAPLAVERRTEPRLIELSRSMERNERRGAGIAAWLVAGAALIIALLVLLGLLSRSPEPAGATGDALGPDPTGAGAGGAAAAAGLSPRGGELSSSGPLSGTLEVAPTAPATTVAGNAAEPSATVAPPLAAAPAVSAPPIAAPAPAPLPRAVANEPDSPIALTPPAVTDGSVAATDAAPRPRVSARFAEGATDVRPGAAPPARLSITPAGDYVVQGGDNLWRLAERHLGDGARFGEIVRLNPGIADPDLIFIGQTLRMPAAGR
jgi:nucleoid-associated protein YgaU